MNDRLIYRIAATIALTGALFFASGQAARASFMQDIFECDFFGNNCTTPLGSIEFPGLTGSQGNGSGFMLSYSNSGVSFDATDISHVAWVMDPLSLILTSFHMELDDNPGCLAGTVGAPCTFNATTFALSSPGMTQVSPSGGGCGIMPDGSTWCDAWMGIVPPEKFVPHMVPEPPALAMMALGLGVAWRLRRTRQTSALRRHQFV